MQIALEDNLRIVRVENALTLYPEGTLVTVDMGGDRPSERRARARHVRGEARRPSRRAVRSYAWKSRWYGLVFDVEQRKGDAQWVVLATVCTADGRPHQPMRKRMKCHHLEVVDRLPERFDGPLPTELPDRGFQENAQEEVLRPLQSRR